MDKLQPTDKKDVFSPEKRLQQVADLRHTLGLTPLDLNSYLGTPETYHDSPSIGIEIEMTWTQAFPELAEQWVNAPRRPSETPSYTSEYHEFSKEYDRLDRGLRPILQIIQKVVPRIGADAYWEFSFLPSKHIGVTLAEIQTLYDAGVLREGVHYATHMTVAGIDNDRDAFAFLCGLELSGGSTLERIKVAMTSQKGGWSRKGKGGLLQRQPQELIGDDTDGYEFRTLVASSPQQLTSLHLTALQLSGMHEQDPEAWRAYRKYIETKLKENGLELEVWPRPQVDQTPWLKYAELLPN